VSTDPDLRKNRRDNRRRAVEHSKGEFTTRFGKEWDFRWTLHLRRLHRRRERLEQRAQRLSVPLAKALVEARLFRDQLGVPRGGLAAEPSYGARVRALVALLDGLPLGTDFLPAKGKNLTRSFKAFLLRAVITTQSSPSDVPPSLQPIFNLLHAKAERRGGLPSDKDMAVVSVLCGEFPGERSELVESDGVPPAAILDDMVEAVRRAKKQVTGSESG